MTLADKLRPDRFSAMIGKMAAIVGTVAVAAVFAASCAAAVQPTPIIIYVTPAPSVSPPTPRVTSTPWPTPTPSAMPTPDVQLEAIGELRYDADACWSDNFTDSAGHRLSGIKVNMAITLKNAGDLPARPGVVIWTSDDDYPSFFTQPGWNGGAGPPISARSTAELQWAVLFDTPFDVNYTVRVMELDSDGTAREPYLLQTGIWTSVSTC